MPAIIIVDAFWGDAGKGKFSAYCSLKYKADICVRAGVGPNAGHSIYQSGTLIKARMIPLGWINPNCKLMIGPGVAVDPVILLEEIKATKTQDRLWVDYRCPIIEARHQRIEKQDKILKKIDSTKSGSGAARADYIMRRGKRAEQIPELRPFLADVPHQINQTAQKKNVIVEGSQATYLSLYLSPRYPYTSSDNCTTAALMDDVGLNWQLVTEVLLLVKCLPTAVGNGPLPNEMSSKEIANRGLQEYGTNTGRPRRRVKKIDYNMLKYSVLLNGPTSLALTYCDQYDPKMQGVTSKSQITDKMDKLRRKVERNTGVQVRYLETGKDFSHIIEI